MASITLTIPPDKVNRVVHALCAAAGNPVENAANAKQAIIDWIRTTVTNVETSEALAAQPVPATPDTTGMVS